VRIKRFLLALPVAMAIACATSETPQRQDGISDFIAVTQLESVNKVRTEGQYSFLRVNESYVILKTPRGHYLGQMQHKCPALKTRAMISGQGNIALWSNVDRRINPKVFFAGQDTILGCVVEMLYLLDENMVTELKNLGGTAT